MAAETINIPGLGQTKKSTAYMLGGAAVLVVGVAWYRSRTADTSGGGTAATDASGTGDQIDPATGYVYGSAEDVAALGGQGSTLGAGYYGGNGSNVSGISTTTGYTTNAQWSQAAEEYLVNTVGADANTVGNALGKYITGQPLSSDQVTVVTQAIAFVGYPPANGPTGYPPSYKTASEPPATTPPPATGGGGSSGGGTTGAFGHITISKVGHTVATLDWPPVSHADGYTVYKNGARTVSVKYSNVALANMRPGASYSIRIVPIPVKGYKVGPVGKVTVKTKK